MTVCFVARILRRHPIRARLDQILLRPQDLLSLAFAPLRPTLAILRGSVRENSSQPCPAAIFTEETPAKPRNHRNYGLLELETRGRRLNTVHRSDSYDCSNDFERKGP